MTMTVAGMHGHRVFNHLLANGASTKHEIGVALGLTDSQVERGLRNIREVLGEHYSEPIVMDPRTYTYDLASTERQAVRYLRYRLSIIKRYLLNLDTGTAGPAAAKFSNPTLDLLRLQMAQTVQTIEFAENSLPV